MSLADWLDDLTVRFLLNLPASELSSVPRLCFQVEEAQWFYEDFIRPAAAAAGKPLPSLPLRQFCLQLFQHTPLLSGFTDAQHIAAYEEFLAYKVRVPVRGAILLDEGMERLVLVKGWKKGASWSFPRGKINKDEKDLDCAVREVYEETGFDVRAAGLVPAKESDMKYIDVTMREQHVRLFVFRGVSEDTHFEPQTRKEISKIDWYYIRDLPGFTRRGADQGHKANKFYMVAPFLGPLKKLINMQRKKDMQQEAQVAVPEHETTQASVEDGTETAEEQVLEPEPTPAPTVVDKSAELRRLLSLGEPPASHAERQPAAAPAPANGPSNSLLDLLRGGASKPANNVPQTPIEQISVFAPPPEAPQPRHPRHPSMGYQQQPVPQFPFSPERLQQQQRNFSVPTPSTFGPPPAGFAQPTSGPYQQAVPPHMQHQHHHLQHDQQRHSLPNGPPPMSGPINGFNISQRQPVQPPPQFPPHLPHHLQHQQHLAPQFPRSSDAFLQPGQQDGPAVPKASNLPMPNLNPHSLHLLNAFKSGNKQPAPGSGVDAGQRREMRQPSRQQAALLDLFRKPGVAKAAEEAPANNSVASPTLSDATERPPRIAEQGRRPTLNEITRTLPAKLKVKSPPPPKQQPFTAPAKGSAPIQRPAPTQEPAPGQAVPSAVQSPNVTTLPAPQILERPKSGGQLFDPTAPVPKQVAQKPEHATVPILQRPPGQHIQRSPKPGRSPKPKHASPNRHASMAARGAENGTPQPQPTYKILARPKSGFLETEKSSGLLSPARELPVLPRQEPSPSRPHAEVQMLRRPESVDPATVQKAAEVVAESTAGQEAGGVDKREQLLALFGKSGIASPPPAPSRSAAPTPTTAAAGGKPNLLSLFNASTAGSSAQQSRTATPTTTMQPPARPQIQPERRPSSNGMINQRQQTPQNALLDLFNRPSSSKLVSPGTLISPFTLGTPAQRHAPQSLASLLSGDASGTTTRTSSGLVQEIAKSPLLQGAPGDRLGSLGSAPDSRKGSGAGTPVETKGFLLDYLNGVVKNEGYKGAGRM